MNNLFKRFKRNKEDIPKPAIPKVVYVPDSSMNSADLRTDIFDYDKMVRNLMDLEGVFIKKVIKPFYKISMNGHDTVFEIFPAFRKAKVYRFIDEISYRDEKDLCEQIKKIYKQ